MGHDEKRLHTYSDSKLAPDPVVSSDIELVGRVRSAGVGSPEYRYLKSALEELAFGTLTGLEKQKKLHPAIRKLGCRLCRPVPASYPENFRSILHLAVLSASPKFMVKQIVDGGWRASERATVRTYFVTAAMFEFAAEYNRFWREEHAVSGGPAVLLDEMNPQLDQHVVARYGADPESSAVNRDAVARIVNEYLLVSGSDPRLGLMLVRTAQQYTQPEIANELGVSAEAVSSAIRRLRNRLTQGD